MTDQTDVDVVTRLPFPALLIGKDDRITALTPAMADMLGHTSEGRHYVTALRQPSVLTAIEHANTSRMPETTRYLGRSGGHDTTYHVHVIPLSAGLMVIMEDQTAVQEVSQMRRDFVANVSHELRTPLTALLGFIETLQGAAQHDPAARDRFLSIMAREADRMTRIVEDLLSLSRVEEDERVRPRDAVDLTALIASSIAGLEPVSKSAGVTVHFQPPQIPLIIPADAGQMGQVMTNLMTNAIKYGASDRGVDVILATDRDADNDGVGRVQIIVRDYGAGIADHHIARLTERFYRVDNHRSREVGGTGLGLAIVKHIVSRHRGRLQIQSAPEQGTTCTITLPAQ